MRHISIFLLILIVAVATGCKTSSGCGITDTSIIRDTVYINKLQHDSVFVKDSVFIREYQRGDTVYVTNDRWHTKYKLQLKHDSIFIHQTDTLRITQTVEVPARLSWWQQIKMHLGGVAVWLLLIVAAFFVIRSRR